MARTKGNATKRLTVAAERERRCADLAIDGWTMRAIADELGMSKSGVADALTRFRATWSAPSLEAWRQILVERYEKVTRLAMKDAESDDPHVRDQAQRRILRATDSLARVTGVEKQPAPIVTVNVGGAAEDDLSMLSVEELHQFRALRAKMASRPALPPAIEAQGHEVTEPEPKEHDDDDRGEHHGEDGSGLDRRA